MHIGVDTRAGGGGARSFLEYRNAMDAKKENGGLGLGGN